MFEKTESIIEAFWQGLFGGIFELLVLSAVAFFVNIIYQRKQDLARAKRDLIDEIDDFSNSFYAPRKSYQSLIDDPALFGELLDEQNKKIYLHQAMYDQLNEITQAIGRFRAIQVKIVPLFGYDIEIFAYYLAIWKYLKLIRSKMERRQSLQPENPNQKDLFYKMIDEFRYRIQVTRLIKQAPPMIYPPQQILDEMYQKSEKIYAKYFENGD
jgi:hypothetical protein